eukprot:gene13196-17799_t
MAHDILIVDDERDICTLIAGILEDEGHTARRAHNSTEAIEAVRIAREGFSAGRFTLLDVLDAEEALNTVQADMITAELERAQAQRLLGGAAAAVIVFGGGFAVWSITRGPEAPAEAAAE